MRIIRAGNFEFKDEGRDSEENIEEMKQHEAQKDINDETVGKKGPVHTFQVLRSIKDKLGNTIELSSTANGSVGWFNVDGVIYEVCVSPAAYGNYFGYFNELMDRKNKGSITDIEDQINI